MVHFGAVYVTEDAYFAEEPQKRVGWFKWHASCSNKRAKKNILYFLKTCILDLIFFKVRAWQFHSAIVALVDLHVWVSVVSCCAVNNWVIASRAHPGCFQWRRMRVNSVRSVETVLIVCHSKMRTLHSINFLSWNKPKWSRIFLGHNRSVLCVNLQILKASRMPKKCT